MSIKCPDSGIQVGSVLQKAIIHRLDLASDANFNRTVATTFSAQFFFRKKQTNLIYLLSIRSCVYFMTKIWDLTNSNHANCFFGHLPGKNLFLLKVFGDILFL